MKIFDKIINLFKSNEKETEELKHKPKEIKIVKKKVKKIPSPHKVVSDAKKKRKRK